MTAPQPAHRRADPTPAPDAYADQLAETVATLAIAVRDDDPSAVGRAVQAALTRPAPAGVDPATALIVALAAAVPDDRPLADLYAWFQRPGRDPVLAGHAEYVRLRGLGLPVPDHIRGLEATYSARRQRARRTRQRTAARQQTADSPGVA
jgi:hypothetical protein